MWLYVLRARLAGRRAFIVFDNLDSAFDMSAEAGTFCDERWPRLPRTCLEPDSEVPVTSHQLARFHDPVTVFKQVDGIARDEARSLVRDAGLKDGGEVLDEAHRLLGGHPMTLRHWLRR